MAESIDRPDIALRGGAVRMTLPARVANDLDGLQRALGSLAERLGHPNCATGCDTLFLQLERDFVVNEEVELNPQPLPPSPDVRLPQDPIPDHRVNVSIPEKVSGDIRSLQRAIAGTLEKLGCGACCSGFDITFRRELDGLLIDDNLDVRGLGSFR